MARKKSPVWDTLTCLRVSLWNAPGASGQRWNKQGEVLDLKIIIRIIIKGNSTKPHQAPWKPPPLSQRPENRTVLSSDFLRTALQESTDCTSLSDQEQPPWTEAALFKEDALGFAARNTAGSAENLTSTLTSLPIEHSRTHRVHGPGPSPAHLPPLLSSHPLSLLVS